MAPQLLSVVELTEQLNVFLDKSRSVDKLADDVALRKLSEAARKVGLATEATGDTVHRIAHSSLQVPLAQIGIDVKLFEHMAEMGSSTASVATLAKDANVDPSLMKRLLRYYQSMGMVAQLGDDEYAPNNVTRAIATKGGRSGISYYHHMINQTFAVFPEFLQKTNYVDPTDNANCPWQLGHNTDKSPFEWLQMHPNLMVDYFLPWMASQRDGLPTFFDVINFEKELAQGANDSTVLFVDIGGAQGHQCVAFKAKHPHLKGRVVLQDLPAVIESVNANRPPGFEGVETQVYDAFKTPQPIKGARAYYLRNVLHDFPDAECVKMLESIKAGMTEESVILIDEMALPERDAPWRATQLDISMITCLAARERSELDWRNLFDQAGLKLRDVWQYTDQLRDCVMVAVPK
ncbi:S-adenosyl-L-methionine-dependent methyltransferase [Astrocystis sublimbata]|nr:S-adenosyl-L-methionine-dependent methyltransferase [Astrocystis sublimbata]